MSKRITVPLDGSSFSEQALPYAVELARRFDASLDLVRVYSPAASVGHSAATGPIGVTTEYLERIAIDLRKTGLSVGTATLSGPIAESIERQVRYSGGDLLVMTTHGRGGISRAWLGSVADTLVRSSNVPVLLLRPNQGAPENGLGFRMRNILIPLDGTGLAEQIIPEARALAGLTGARLTLLQVIAPPTMVSTPDAIVGYRDAVEESRETREEAMAYLDDVAAHLIQAGFEVATCVMEQSQTALGIIEQAVECGADLIAMATHGRRGWARIALGSVADKVLRSTTVPLLLWRERDALALDDSDLVEVLMQA